MDEEIVVLFHASLLGRTDVIQQVITNIRNNSKDEDKNEVIQMLSIERDEDKLTPLHIASLNGHSDVVRYLLNAGSPLSLSPKDGEYKNKKPYDLSIDKSKEAFHIYLFEQIAIGDIDIITKLLIGGIPVEILDGSNLNDSILHWACSFGNNKLINILYFYDIFVLYHYEYLYHYFIILFYH